ncbi:MAG: PTS-dependent dihydroxyacetone kinase phosphotransferase subunit DhaM [Lachnospiraceae bacterium]|nr:PTS-dependent dihydroxyacetone kinase phosphotransferase subunit DhaM [Lachnospiraceae bacterium]
MVGVVIVSHSKTLAEGVLEFCRVMAAEAPLVAAGGMEDGSFGTSFEKIKAAVESVNQGEGVLVLMDVGSAVMTTEMVLEDIADDSVQMVDCPLVVGAIAAAVAAEGGLDFESVKAEALSAWDARKLS